MRIILSKEQPPLPIDVAKQHFANQRLIAIIGTPNTGKTVVGALLLEAIIDEFLPNHTEYTFRINKGINTMKNSSLSLKKGEFPSGTAEDEINQVEMILKQNKASGGEIELKLNDISGELQRQLLTKEISGTTLIQLIMNQGKQKGDQFGPYTFLIFSEVYVFLIDSEQFENWSTVAFEYAQLLLNILEFKKAINQVHNDKIKNPIAVMFTKTDLLDEEQRVKSPENLLKEKMSIFYQQLLSIVENKEYFKVFIDVERGPDNKPIQVKIGKPSVNEAKGESLTTSSSETSEIKEPAEVPKETQESVAVTYKVKTPLSYSKDEYVKFISWLDKVLTRPS